MLILNFIFSSCNLNREQVSLLSLTLTLCFMRKNRLGFCSVNLLLLKWKVVVQITPTQLIPLTSPHPHHRSLSLSPFPIVFPFFVCAFLFFEDGRSTYWPRGSRRYWKHPRWQINKKTRLVANLYYFVKWCEKTAATVAACLFYGVSRY